MDISYFLPEELSQYFGIPLYAIIIIVFILGFITSRLTQKHGALKKRLNSFDDIFLIVVIGLVWLFRIYWTFRMLNPLFNDPELFFSFWLVPIVAFMSLALIIVSSINDFEIIFNRPIRSRKTRRNVIHFLYKRADKYVSSKHIDKNIRTTNYFMVGLTILYVIAIIMDKGDIEIDLILTGLLLIFSFTPFIWFTINLYKYLTS